MSIHCRRRNNDIVFRSCPDFSDNLNTVFRNAHSTSHTFSRETTIQGYSNACVIFSNYDATAFIFKNPRYLIQRQRISTRY